MYGSCTQSRRNQSPSHGRNQSRTHLMRTVECLGSMVSTLGLGGAWHRVISMGGVRGKREVRTVCISTRDERAVIVD